MWLAKPGKSGPAGAAPLRGPIGTQSVGAPPCGQDSGVCWLRSDEALRPWLPSRCRLCEPGTLSEIFAASPGGPRGPISSGAEAPWLFPAASLEPHQYPFSQAVPCRMLPSRLQSLPIAAVKWRIWIPWHRPGLDVGWQLCVSCPFLVQLGPQRGRIRHACRVDQGHGNLTVQRLRRRFESRATRTKGQPPP